VKQPKAAQTSGQLTVEYWPLERPIPYARNPRKNDGAVDKVAASIKEFGWKQPIVVDSEGVIVVGHTRLLAARKLGLGEVPVVVASDLTPAQCKAYRLADNRSNEEAEWDAALLALELDDLKIDGFDLRVTGFDPQEISAYDAIAHSTEAGVTDDDDVPAPPAKPRSVPGDLWLLGHHRVLCGDATSMTDVERLLDGVRADLVIIDPPYNVSYVGKTKDALTLQNDALGDERFYDFLRDSFVNLFVALKDGGGIYVFHSDTEGLNFRRAFAESGLKLSQVCIWVKQTMVMGRHDYHWQHEPVLYGWKPGAAHPWHADRKQTTLWKFDRPLRSADHPTMKPIALLEYPIRNSSLPGAVVLDVFGGSGSTLIACEKTTRAPGSTLIACEKTARRALLMELDPVYVDVIVARWQAFTGRHALHEDGTAFNSRAPA
jgi:DNA modification methylase